MNLWSKIELILQEKKMDREEKRYQEWLMNHNYCDFSEGITYIQFKEIVKKAGKRINRIISITVDGPVVSGSYISNSGLSEWTFQINYNDHGRLTGNYSLIVENQESTLPQLLARNISSRIVAFPFVNEQSSDSVKTEEKKDDGGYNQQNFRKMYAEEKRLERERTKQKIDSLISGVKTLIIVSLLFVMGYILFSLSMRKKVGIAPEYAVGKDYSIVEDLFGKNGFTNICSYPREDLTYEEIERENQVIQVLINGSDDFTEDSVFQSDSEVTIVYHSLMKITVPISSKDAKKLNYEEVVSLLSEAGFVNINTVEDCDLITGWIIKDGTVETITINGDKSFELDDHYRPDAEIDITYHTFSK